MSQPDKARAGRYLLAIIQDEPAKAQQAIIEAADADTLPEVIDALGGWLIGLLRIMTRDDKDAIAQWASDQILAARQESSSTTTP